MQIDSQFERLAQGALIEAPDFSDYADGNNAADADMEAEHQIQSENGGGHSAINSQMDNTTTNDEPTISAPNDTEPSPTAIQPSKKRRMADNTPSSPVFRSPSKKRRPAADTAPSPSPRKPSRIADGTAPSPRKAPKKRQLADDNSAEDEEL